ncbi:MAG: FAD-dependent oxidoreductase [Vicinamibacterales bacterium]
MDDHQPVRRAPDVPVTRRAFLSAALVGLSPKSANLPTGRFVDPSYEIAHRWRDGRLRTTAREEHRADVVVVGGGIAGLGAARRLQSLGLTDVVVLELERDAGGNARSGENAVSAYPWGAHYVPVPDTGSALIRELFRDLGVLAEEGWDDRALCFAPQERLFIHGRWQEGLEAQVGPTRRDKDQLARFEDTMRELGATGAFKVPRERGAGADTRATRALDDLPMSEWLDRGGWDSPYVRWLVDYACRDDYGARPSDVSAWAGVHYFASRTPDDTGPLTWPAGNGWIVNRLLERVGAMVRTGELVVSVERAGNRWTVATERARWRAAAVVFAAPAFLLPFVSDDRLAPALLAPRDTASPASTGGADAARRAFAQSFTYSPWMTANLTLDRLPVERGFPLAWDNVIFDSPGLGYVVATHQSLRVHQPRSVWTYYLSLADGSPAANRQWLLGQSWETLAGRVLDDLSRAHPDIRACVSNLDIMRLGHGMVRPTPGFLSSPLRQALRDGRQGFFGAHSDVSGLSLFEEAYVGGVRAAERAAAWVGRS